MPRSDQFDHGYVVGILVTSRIDGPDEDRLPDAVGATSVRPEFKRAKGQYRLPLHTPESGAHGMFVSSESIRCAVMPSGHITSDVDTTGAAKPDAQPGVWLPVGTYAVSFGGHFPGFDIEVTTAHTVEAPLDLWSWAPVQPGPGTPTTVLPVPVGAATGDVLGWGVDGLTWLAPGTVDPAVIEAAVQDYLTANPPPTASWDTLDGKPDTFPPAAHEHPEYLTEADLPTPPDLSDVVRDSDPRLTDAREPLPHTHPEYENPDLSGYVQDTDPRLTDARTPTEHTHSWDEVTGKPATFPPAEHSHSEYLTAGDLPDPPDLSGLATWQPVTTGDEPRPDAGLVIWVGGTTQPTNMGVGDIWYQEQPQ